jgi:hypothetical protein
LISSTSNTKDDFDHVELGNLISTELLRGLSYNLNRFFRFLTHSRWKIDGKIISNLAQHLYQLFGVYIDFDLLKCENFTIRLNKVFRIVAEGIDKNYNSSTKFIHFDYFSDKKFSSKAISSFSSGRWIIINSSLDILNTIFNTYEQPSLENSNHLTENFHLKFGALRESVQTCTELSLPSILKSALPILKANLMLLDNESNESFTTFVTEFLNEAWNACLNFNYFDLSSYVAFVKLIYDPTIISLLPKDFTKVILLKYTFYL